MVTDRGEVQAVAVFLCAQVWPILQLAFLEFLPSTEALDCLMGEARRRARAKGLHKIAVGINGHLNYGLGLLRGTLEEPALFGSGYNKDYYVPMLAPYGMRETRMTSYRWAMPTAGLERYDRCCDRLEKHYTFRTVSARRLREDAASYTLLSNRCFAGHAFYYPRTAKEDYEMLRELLFLAGEEFLIFAYYGDKPVGLILWYPDFNQCLAPGGKVDVGGLLNIKLHARRISRMKLAELAVLPEHSGRGLPVCLLRQVAKRCGERFSVGESSWILEENSLSVKLTQALGGRPRNHYVAYEMDVE